MLWATLLVCVSSFGMCLCYFTRLSHLPSSTNLFWNTVSGVSPSTWLWASVSIFPGCSHKLLLSFKQSLPTRIVYKLRCLYVRVISLNSWWWLFYILMSGVAQCQYSYISFPFGIEIWVCNMVICCLNNRFNSHCFHPCVQHRFWRSYMVLEKL